MSCFASFADRVIVGRPKASDLIGAWSGHSNHNDFLRLEFEKNATGYLSFISNGHETVDVYRVRKWTLSNWGVVLELEPLSREAESFQFKRVVFDHMEMKCEFAGDRGWERKATLFSERNLRDLTDRAQKAVTNEKRRRK